MSGELWQCEAGLEGPGSSSEGQCWVAALCWGSFQSPGSKDSVHVPELQHEKHLHFGYRDLVWGCTVLLTMSHSCDRATGWGFSTLVVTNLRKPPGGAVRMERRNFSHYLLKSVAFYFNNELDWMPSHHTECLPFLLCVLLEVSDLFCVHAILS